MDLNRDACLARLQAQSHPEHAGQRAAGFTSLQVIAGIIYHAAPCISRLAARPNVNAPFSSVKAERTS